MTSSPPPGTACGRLLPYPVHAARSEGGARCGRPAVDMLGPAGQGEEARCAVHRGIDQRTETNRLRRRARDEALRRRPR